MDSLVKLTDYEIEALQSELNLADGHARYSLRSRDLAFLPKVTALLGENLNQVASESLFVQEFFHLVGEVRSPKVEQVLFCPSASLSIEIVANYLRLNNFSVALIEPVFDNLADILRRHRIPLQPLRESERDCLDTSQWIKTVQADALFLVVPNNPTGQVFSQTEFKEILGFCASTHRLLILDFSFRHHSHSLKAWQQYELLERSGVRYIAIEDTGKTWPTSELKVSPMLACDSVFPALRSIYRDIFVCCSPVALSLLAIYFKEEQAGNFVQSPTDIIAANRALLRKALANTPQMRPITREEVSVEWLELSNNLTSSDLEFKFRCIGVHILPGNQFFWSDPDKGSRYIRIALARDPKVFAMAVRQIERALASEV